MVYYLDGEMAVNRKTVDKKFARPKKYQNVASIEEGEKPNASIKDRDKKILWARAAGRCSMPDCRVLLTLDKKKGNSSTLGAICHIVGEKKNAARGDSPLSPAERNSYSNLILLCSHHHDIIDNDVEKYPTEVLHQIKAEHELWVNERLSNPDPDPDELVYSNLIDTLSTVLQLDKWSWFIDNGVRDVLHEDFLYARGVLNAKLLGTIWPKKKIALERAIKEVIKAFNDYIVHYESNAEPRRNGIFFGPDRSYARFSNPRYEEYVDREERWSDKNFWLLCNYIVKLNKFADAVRRYSNPMFYRTHGKFLVLDELGYRFGGQGTIYLPTADDIKKGLATLETK